MKCKFYVDKFRTVKIANPCCSDFRESWIDKTFFIGDLDMGVNVEVVLDNSDFVPVAMQIKFCPSCGAKVVFEETTAVFKDVME